MLSKPKTAHNRSKASILKPLANQFVGFAGDNLTGMSAVPAVLQEPKKKTRQKSFFVEPQEAILHQGEQIVLFTQDFGKFEGLLEQLSSGELQDELNYLCGYLMEDKELQPEFERFGLEQFVELHNEFVMLTKGIYELNEQDVFRSDFFGTVGNENGLTEYLRWQLERNREITKARKRISEISYEELFAYAQKAEDLESRADSLLSNAETQLAGLTSGNGPYQSIAKSQWKNFLGVVRKGIDVTLGKKLKKAMPGDSNMVAKIYAALNSDLEKKKGLLPILGGKLKADFEKTIAHYENALSYLVTVRSAAANVYPYFEMQIFVEAQRLANVSESDAKKVFDAYKKACNALSQNSFAEPDHIILTPTEIRVGGYARGSEIPLYACLPNPRPKFTELFVRYGIR